MAQLSEEAIAEFRALWKREYGEQLTEEQARDHANRLFFLIQKVFRPIPAKDETTDNYINRKYGIGSNSTFPSADNPS